MKFTISFLTLVAVACAAPADLLKRAGATCGSKQYSADAVNRASQAACSFFKAGSTAGGSSYPHQYNNYEGFSFGGVSGPYQEFPILSSGQIYSGGKIFFF